MSKFAWLIVVGLIAGCTYDGGNSDHHDKPDRKRGNETIERSIIASDAKYDLAQADAYRKIGEDLDRGKVFTVDEVQKRLDEQLGGKDGDYQRAFHPKNQLLHDSAEKGGSEKVGRYGRREAKLFFAISRGFEMAGKAKGGSLSDDERRDDE
jgi:hypothetical protein